MFVSSISVLGSAFPTNIKNNKQFNEISLLNQCSNNKDLSTHTSQHKLKIHVSTLLLQLTSTPLFKKEILCIWFLSWNLYLTKHKDSTKIVLTHTNSNSHKNKIQPNTQQIQVCNKNELLSKYGCCPITIATKSSRNQTTFVILDSNLI